MRDILLFYLWSLLNIFPHANLTHGTGPFECYLELTLGAAAVRSMIFSCPHSQGSWSAKPLMLGERVGSEDDVMHLTNPFVVMTSLMPKIHRSVSFSALDLLLSWVLPEGYWVFLSTVLIDPELRGRASWVLCLPVGQGSEGSFPWLVVAQAWILLMLRDTPYGCKRKGNYLLR